ncbi:MAG TPA: hypothetical protein VGC99_24780 [Candidatus Tectomicrobia bacterium]
MAELPKAIQDSSWKAQVRLCTRFRQLTARGKQANQVVVAIARNMAAFVWALAREVPIARETPYSGGTR